MFTLSHKQYLNLGEMLLPKQTGQGHEWFAHTPHLGPIPVVFGPPHL